MKFGKGIAVSAKENTQMMIYALGAITDELLFMEPPPDDFKVILHIHQPRIPDERYPSTYERQWETTVGHLREFLKIVQKAVKHIEHWLKRPDEIPTDGFNPGEKQCRWCKAKPLCTAHKNWLLAEFDACDGDKEEAEYLAPEELEELIFKAPLIEKFFESITDLVKDLIIEQNQSGEETPDLPIYSDDFPRLKVDHGKGRRVWKEGVAEEVVAALRNKHINPWQPEKLITITDAKKTLDTEEMKAFTDWHDGPTKVMKR